MPGFVPGIHVLVAASKVVDGRDIGERKRRRPTDGYARPWRSGASVRSRSQSTGLPLRPWTHMGIWPYCWSRGASTGPETPKSLREDFV